MDVRYINPFIVAVQHIFETMLDSKLLIAKPTVKKHGASKYDISAVIGFSGPVTGSVSLCFRERAAVAIASRFSGTDLSIHNDADLADALGELTNMVAGGAKANLPEDGISISLPRVVSGRDHQSVASHDSPVLVLACDCPISRFWIEVAMLRDNVSPFIARAL